MLGPSAELNVTFVLSNSTLTNDTTFKVYFFKSYENLLQCRNSEAAATRTKCPRSFSLPGVSGMSSFSYANGSYGLNVEREDLSEKPFEGQHYFLTKFLGTSPGSPSRYDNLFVNFTFRYSTTGVLNPLATGFTGQKCKYLDDTNDKIYEYKCGVDYGSFFTAGRSRCTYLTLATPYIAPEIDSRFRDLFPVTITERHRDDVMIFIAGVVLLAILFVLIASSGLLFKTVRNRRARREYRPLP